MEGKIMKHTKLLVVALLVALMACLAVVAIADDSHNLVWDQNSYVYPTCDREGVEVWVCTNDGCDYSVTMTLPATGHRFASTPDAEGYKPATCGSAGFYQYTCQNIDRNTGLPCGHVKKITIPATGEHDYQKVLDEGKAPTCTANGLGKTMGCIVCGKKMADPVVIPALGHEFTENAWTVAVSATCARDGILSRKCNRCDYVDTKNVGKADHHTDADGNPLTPSLSGQYNAYGKKATDANYKTIALCIMPMTAPSCTTDGCTAVFQCPTCGATKGGELIPAYGHDVNGAQWIVKVPATCATEGVLGRKCMNGCGTWLETKSVGKADHHTDWNGDPISPLSAYNTYKETANESNYKTIYNCIAPARPATCTEDGCYAIFQCPTCGATKGGTVWAKSGHKLDPRGWTTDPSVYPDATTTPAPATCTKDGTMVAYCLNCHKYLTTKVPAFGHSASWKITLWPDALNDNGMGKSELTCVRCGEVLGVQFFKDSKDAPTGTVNTGVSTTSNPIVYGGNTSTHNAATASVGITNVVSGSSATSTAKEPLPPFWRL
jgi:hypothetical protein